MGLLRRGDNGGRKFLMREKLLSVGDDSWIEDEAARRSSMVRHCERVRPRSRGPFGKRGRAHSGSGGQRSRKDEDRAGRA